MKRYRFLDWIMVIFVTVLVVSNIASSAKIIDLGIKIGTLPMAFDAGTILFPVSYIFGDVLTEVYGYKRSRRVIWSGFVCLALSAAVLALVGILPGESTWQQAAGDTAYRSILGGMISGGILLASLAAYWSGEFTNSFVLARMKVLTRGRWLWTRTIGSTLAGEMVDTLVFVLVATVMQVFPWSLFLTLLVSNYLFKVLIEIVMTPLTYLTVNWLKKVENEDYYDHDTDFNPFR